MSDVIAIIPARYGSTRFPGKLLADRTGKPLIQHVHEQVSRAAEIGRVIVATDDDRIAAAVRGFGGKCVMTQPEHPNGTSRLAEAAESLDADIIVNVQGDEPEIEPAVIDRAVKQLRDDSEAPVSTVASPFADDEDPADPNIVKVVLDQRGRALYFSRALVPHQRDPGTPPRRYKHIGLYVYRRNFLLAYPSLSPTPLEQAERLEQLRVLEHGYAISVAVVDAHHHGIDTPEQYDAFVARQSMQAM